MAAGRVGRYRSYAVGRFLPEAIGSLPGFTVAVDLEDENFRGEAAEQFDDFEVVLEDHIDLIRRWQ